VPQFDYSLKAQARNPKKVYAIDNGLVDAVSTSASRNLGHRLENAVYLHLRARYPDIYYFKGKGEIKQAVQSKRLTTARAGFKMRCSSFCFQNALYLLHNGNKLRCIF